jgi:hypothetical protein
VAFETPGVATKKKYLELLALDVAAVAARALVGGFVAHL